jgi:hypothetical protein
VGTTAIRVSCPSTGAACFISDGGAYLDGQPIPRTSPSSLIQAIPILATVSPGDTMTLQAVTATGRVDDIAAGEHTFRIGYKQTTGDPATVTLAQGQGYSLISPQP